MLTYFNLKEASRYLTLRFCPQSLMRLTHFFNSFATEQVGSFFYTESDLNGKETVSTCYNVISVFCRSFRMFNFIALTTEKTYIEINGMEV